MSVMPRVRAIAPMKTISRATERPNRPAAQKPRITSTIPTISKSHQASLSSFVAKASTMSSIPLNSRYHPTKAASIANVPPGWKNTMALVTMKITPRTACNQFQLGAVNALNNSAMPAVRITTPARIDTATTEVRSNRRIVQAMTNHAAAVIRYSHHGTETLGRSARSRPVTDVMLTISVPFPRGAVIKGIISIFTHEMGNLSRKV